MLFTFTQKHFILGLLAFILIICSCSDSHKDYEELQRLQDANEQILKNTFDYDIRIKSCNDVITALQKYLSSHSSGEWVNTARTAVESWQSRLKQIEMDKSRLTNDLETEMYNRAVKEAQNRHSLSHIENISLTNSTTQTEGNQFVEKNSYAVRMQGDLIGTSIFKMDIHVIGQGNMVTGNIAIDNNVVIEE